MSKTVDARGLSCPQPVLMVLDAIKHSVHGAEIEVLVDTETSKENIVRAVKTKGWRVHAVQPEGGGYRMHIAKE